MKTSVKKRKIGIIGIGVVGMALRRYFEAKGHKRGVSLFCYDTDAKKGYFDDIGESEIVFVSVPTPALKDGSCDTSMLHAAVASIPGNKVVVIRSTVSPGTTDMLASKHPQHELLFYPEFLTEANIERDFLNPDRQILAHREGGENFALEILALLPKGAVALPRQGTGVRPASAELGKLGANGFGAMKVTYGNILADLCDGLGIVNGPETVNYEDVRGIIASDKRIGHSWLNVNHGNYRGFGGFCFPKDFRNLITSTSALIKDLRKKKVSKIPIARLERALAVFKAVYDYNEFLLETQGLSIDDVSRHENDLARVLGSDAQVSKKKKRATRS